MVFDEKLWSSSDVFIGTSYTKFDSMGEGYSSCRKIRLFRRKQVAHVIEFSK